MREKQGVSANSEDEDPYGPVTLNFQNELQCRELLRKYLDSIGQWSIDKVIEDYISLDGGVAGRFEYFLSKVPKTVLKRLLVSGCAAGSELIIARNVFGFQEITATDVVADFVHIAQSRLSGYPGFHVDLYDGTHLPYPDGCFAAIVSGHIIEHTQSPFDYLREHVRVLAHGGYFFLEFPDRYHPIELHTSIHSMEFLDDPLRDIMLTYLASPQSPFPEEKRKLFERVRRGLKPIGVDLIKKYLEEIDPWNCSIMHHYEPLPGFMRLIIEKRAVA